MDFFVRTGFLSKIKGLQDLAGRSVRLHVYDPAWCQADNQVRNMQQRNITFISTADYYREIAMEKTTKDLAATLASRVVGQPNGINAIVPCIEMFQAGLAPDNRPVGVFLLLGPTGTGKTRTVEALAEALHGSIKNVLKIDCGEFQMEHEVAKLIGAPPGYLGHRETQPLLSQQKLTSVASPKCGLSIVLFDEIEKAAPSMARLLLGVLDRGVLRLGDNASVNFEKTIVFMTSNLGTREMMREITPDFGFQAAGATASHDELKKKLQNIGLAAVRRRFSPEFVNRIDHVVTYEPLTASSFAAITDHEIDRLQGHVESRLGNRAFVIDAPWQTRQWLMEKGTSAEYGARELKRTIHRHLTQPLASLVSRQQIAAGGRVLVEVSPDGMSLNLHSIGLGEPPMPVAPSVLVVDDNAELLKFMTFAAVESRWDPLSARTVTEARKLFSKREVHAAIIDLGVNDGGGVDLALDLRDVWPDVQVVLTCETDPSNSVLEVCDDHDFEVVRKPFLTPDLLDFLRDRVLEVRTNC